MNLKAKLRRVPRVVIYLICFLVILRAALPYAVKWYVNDVLAGIPGYYGHVEDIDLSLWRGSYQIEDLKLLKVNKKVREPFLSIKEIDLAVDWKALWHGKVATRIEMDRPYFIFVKGSQPSTTQMSVDDKWQTQVQKLYPFEINSFIVHGGGIRFKNNTTKPLIDVHLSELELTASNLTNATDKEENLFSQIKATSKIQKDGKFSLDMKVNPFVEPIAADFNGKVEELSLTELNDFAKAYGNFDFEKGKASLYTEFVTAKNDFKGYSKLLMVGVDVLDWSNEKGDSFLHKIWEGLVGAGFEMLQNQGKDQFALRLPLEGKLDKIETKTWSAFWSILRNAFIEAFTKKLENSFDFSSLKKAKPSK